jgi:hypothetical protein
VVKSTEKAIVFTKRTVKPGFNEQFDIELHDFIAQSLQTEGQLGVSVMSPVEGSRRADEFVGLPAVFMLLVFHA